MTDRISGQDARSLLLLTEPHTALEGLTALSHSLARSAPHHLSPKLCLLPTLTLSQAV